ncbi:hypothetical protein [Microbacterium sp. bgisy189]|uniref:hypothetical protein n=1 Tax=Microbacterium sp. bgisy189 TaxID=3413798 RepID=UPI003EB7CE80
MPTNKRVVQPIDEVIGARIKHLRTTTTPKPMTIDEFGRQMRERLGQGWQPPAVMRVERGQQPMRFAELVAAADVFHCTVAEIVDTPTPVHLGGDGEGSIVARLDAVMGGADSIPESVIFERFERAAEALNEQRHAEARYRNEIDAVRRALARGDEVSESLRARILARGRGAVESLRVELEAMHAEDIEHARVVGAEPPPMWAPVVPLTVAAKDALSDAPLPAEIWAQGRAPRNRPSN